ncbi:MAG: nucleotidyltransferase family protein [Xenococcaceae cyanobacterium MO_188.B29]|nr:nucleotidyltransferase family protein [Xenococcaceae cyanobacterium MO_188.B29]
MNTNKDRKSPIAAIILAAGASRRMGQPKQLLPYRGQTLLSYVTKCTLASSCSPVIVILGANVEKIEPEIVIFPVKIIKNTQGNEGISSSIRCGIAYIQEQLSNLDGVVFLTGDQPFISAAIIDQLIDAHNLTNKPIIASQYQKTLGIPALFSRSLFSELMELKGDRGAKKIINKYPDLVQKIDFPQGEIDLDTFEDYLQIISRDDINC